MEKNNKKESSKLEEEVRALEVKYKEEVEEKRREIKVYRRLENFEIDCKLVEEKIPKLKEDLMEYTKKEDLMEYSENDSHTGAIVIDPKEKIGIYLSYDSERHRLDPSFHNGYCDGYTENSVTLHAFKDKEKIGTRTFVYGGRYINHASDRTPGDYHTSPELRFRNVEILDANETELKIKLTTSLSDYHDEVFDKILIYDLEKQHIKHETDIDRTKYKYLH